MSSFNLVDEPWIPGIASDGSRQRASLRDVLCNAHAIREIHDPSPLVTVALHRLLLAILHRVFGPKSSADWKLLWQRGQWDATALELYLTTWKHRFDLFDTWRPFGQVPRMAEAGVRPIAALLLEAASGNNATLFDHGKVEGVEAIPAGRAACYLLAYQAFAIGLGNSRPFDLKDGPLTRGLNVLAYGDNLFETTALNLTSEAFWPAFQESADDAPFWERDSLPEPDERGTFPLGRTDYLTWLSRRIHLVPQGSPSRVAWCQIQQNYRLATVPIRWDPFKRYKRDDKGVWSPEGLAADKAVWRDCHALLHMKLPDGSRPEVLDWLGKVNQWREAGEIVARPQYQLAIFGLATAALKPRSVERWRSERLPLPLAYLNDEFLLDQLKQALDLARDVGTALRRSMWFLAGQLVTELEVEALVRQIAAENLFWPNLEEPFRRLLEAIPQGDDLQSWGEELSRAARKAFRAVRLKLETSRGALKALVTAEGYFNRELSKALEPVGKEREYESAV